MPAAANKCPTQAELSDFVLGIMPENKLATVFEHLEHCPKCARLFETMDEQSDSLIKQLRQLSPTENFVPQPVPNEWIEAACGSFPEVSVDSWPAGERPQKLGKFELLQELGIGSFGYVFRARDTELDRIVAVKVLRAGRLAGKDDVDRFLREARSAAQLKHPGIVSIFETGQSDEGAYFLVEEFVSGEDLASFLRHRQLTISESTRLIAEIAEALHYAHENGVIHRDVKPSNIMMDQDQRPHLMDFGLAKREADEQAMTMDGQVLGTPAYMSPEQARGESHGVDARSDLYSLGVLLYELLTGGTPFRGNRRMLLLQVLQDEPAMPRKLNDKIPRDLETVCMKAMAKAPHRRYATAQEMADDLHRFLDGMPVRARPVGHIERVWRWSRRNPFAVSVLLAVTASLLLGLGYLSWLSDQLVRSTARESCAQTAEMLEQVNQHYSNVIEDVKKQGYALSEDPDPSEGSKGMVKIEVPAQFTINLGNRLEKFSESGMQVRLFSKYPFKSRKDGGPKDDFGRVALAELERRPDTPVYRFEEFQGSPVLRYAVARRMEKSCVSCHNNHPDSIKHDWQVGDVRGVLEIIRPLDRDITRTREGLRGTYLLILTVSGSLLGICVLVIVVRNRNLNRR